MADSDKTIFNMAVIRHLQLSKIWSRDLHLCVILLLHTKFGVNQTIILGDMAKKSSSWRPSAL